MNGVYYNDNDPKICAFLRELMADNLISQGTIDERSIADVRPADLAGFTRAHFFAGQAGWERALQLADFPPDEQIWTASLPCQPWSCAGLGLGENDPRHLAPVFLSLVRDCLPQRIVGEQVPAAIGKGWIAGIHAGLAAQGYSFGFTVLGAHSVKSPHRRQRIFWMARRRMGNAKHPQRRAEHEKIVKAYGRDGFGRNGDICLADGLGARLEGHTRNGHDRHEPGRQPPRTAGPTPESGLAGVGQPSSTRGLGDPDRPGQRQGRRTGAATPSPPPGPSATLNGFWSDYLILPMRDGKSRRIPRPQSLLQPMAPGLPPVLDPSGAPRSLQVDRLSPEDAFPLSQKIPGRVTLLKAAGNSIVPQSAAAFLLACQPLWL